MFLRIHGSFRETGPASIFNDRVPAWSESRPSANKRSYYHPSANRNTLLTGRERRSGVPSAGGFVSDRLKRSSVSFLFRAAASVLSVFNSVTGQRDVYKTSAAGGWRVHRLSSSLKQMESFSYGTNVRRDAGEATWSQFPLS